ncbi:MAG: glycosyltransferase family 4 protein [Tissierellia bacterium]|nr:glycosyltransferase family 4 protein [Tissierellia bacterium]
MKKVLFLVNHDVVIYNFRRELVERLLHDGYEVYISSPYGERIDDLVAMGCEFIETSIERHGTNILEDLKLLMHYNRIIKVINPDVVLSYTIKPNIYGGLACMARNVPYIANITGLGTAVENKGLIQKLTILLYKVAFRKVNCVFFQNKQNRQFFIDNKVKINNYRLIPGSGVNLDYFHVLDYPSNETTEFVFISRIMKEKGIDEYLEAAECIKSEYPNTRFHICGFCEERYEDKLKEMQDKGIISYHGMIKDVREYLRKCSAIIHPTYHEGMSNVLLEAAATGRPVLASNIPGCKEIFTEGVSGFGFEAKNVGDLVDTIKNFIELPHNKKRAMGLAGRKKVEKEFNRQIIIEAYLLEITRIMGES